MARCCRCSAPPTSVMRRRLARAAAATAVVLTVAGVACEKSPTRPGFGSFGNPPLRLEIVGPSRVAPQESVQFRVTSFSGGIERDATSEATWTTSDPTLITISRSGLATGHDRGDATITGTVQGLQVAKPVMVIPAGTYRVLGIVHEAGTTLRVGNARVEARDNTVTVAETVTDSTGQFRLYGAPPNAELHVSRDGYRTHVERLTLDAHGSVNIGLALAVPRPDVSGTYTFTVGSDTCSNSTRQLPPELRRRTFGAVVTQKDAELKVTLTGADFKVIRGALANDFFGTLASSGATFTLTPPGYYYAYTPEGAPDVVEELSEGISLLVTGLATTTVSSRGMSGTLSGTLEAYQGSLTFTAATARCTSTTHPFVLSR
jgi:hypothetical protein